MTEEDQKLVALAALHGARFYRVRIGEDLLWRTVGSTINKWSIGRAAEWYLWKEYLRTDEQHHEYDRRTDALCSQELDPEWLAQFGACVGSEVQAP